MNLDKEKTLAFLKQLLWLASIGVKITPNTTDDQVVAILTNVVNNQQLVDFIFELLNTFAKDKASINVETLKAKLAELN